MWRRNATEPHKGLESNASNKEKKGRERMGEKSSMLWDHGDLKPTEENVMLSTL